MATITERKNVQLFSDENVIGEQIVHIDPNDPCGPWINVSQDGNEISLSLQNWNSLVELFELAKSKM